MQVTVFGIKNCNTMKKAFRWFEENEIEYEFIDVKKDPLTIDELASFSYLIGIDTLLNKKGTTWKKEGLTHHASDEELLNWLSEHQTAIKRPLLLVDESVMVGFDEDAYKSLLLSEEE